MAYPAEIKRVGNHELRMIWDDRHESVYPMTYLRKECPCAECLKFRNQPKSALRVISGPVYETVEVKEMDLAGNYALNISFTDGHNTGIFSFDYLREICPCPSCKKP
ncbi:MAG: gamma-butyrobetaine hydroxylase-like domain-containing protein [Nitrospiria bacterium]